MKGLLYKDLILVAKYCRTYLVMLVVFLAVSFVSDGNFFFTFYPCMLAGMIPMTILSCDERSRWQEYSGTLPCTREALVSVKYLLGLLMVLAAFVPSVAALALRQAMSGAILWGALLSQAPVLLALGLVVPSICMPLVFRLGVEKGRIVYLFMTAFICAAAVSFSGILGTPRLPGTAGRFFPLLAIAIVAALYTLSWRVAVAVYKKREL